MPHYRRGCVRVPLKQREQGGGGRIGVGVVCVRERGDSPFWQNHVIVKQRDKEALFTIWSPFWS